MYRAAEDILGLAYLHDLAQIHHLDPVAQISNRAEIMGNELVSHIELLLQTRQKGNDMNTQRHVQ